MTRLTVLVSSAGRRVELLKCFRADAERLGINLQVLAADLAPDWSAACAEADNSFRVPRCTAPDFPGAIAEICESNQVDLLIPTIDTELMALATIAPSLRAAGTSVVVSSPEAVALARDKAATATWLAGHGVTTPRTCTATEAFQDLGSWERPVVLKPRGGSSSIGLIRAKGLCDVDPTSINTDTYIVQELVSGDEYTVNVFVGVDGNPKAVVPHQRVEVRAGEVSKGVTRRCSELEAAGWVVGSQFPAARGAFCFQAIVDAGGDAHVFEINARFGGGYPLAHRAGARFTQWLLEEATGRQPSYHNDWRSGVTMLRYDAAYFLGSAE